MTIDEAYKLLEDDHNNFDLWSVLGDLYEDSGNDQVVKAIRWMVANNKRPWYGFGDYGHVHWYNEDEVGSNFDLESNLPGDMFKSLFDMVRIKENTAKYDYDYINFRTRRAAIEYLAMSMVSQ